jgi:hypothetical protein
LILLCFNISNSISWTIFSRVVSVHIALDRNQSCKIFLDAECLAYSLFFVLSSGIFDMLILCRRWPGLATWNVASAS